MLINSKFSIQPHLAYRYIDDEYVIVLDWKNKNTHFLKDRVFSLWRGIDSHEDYSYSDQEDLDIITNLLCLGLIQSKVSLNVSNEGNNFKRSANTNSVISRWASVNNIPLNGSFELTGVCNLHCKHCYSIHEATHQLTLAQIFNIIDQLKRSGTISLTVTGGEIFSRPDCDEIFSYLCENKFNFRINTNGNYITEEVASNLMCYPQLSHIHVSLYSDKPEIHDGITGVKGSFEKSIQALRYLKRFTDKNIRINCTVMKSNATTYKNVKTNIGDTLDIPVRYDSRLVAMDNGCQDNLSERIEDAQLKSHYEWMLSENLADKTMLMHPKQTGSEQVGLCSAGFSYFSVSYEGILYPCFQLRFPIGNLLKNDFLDLWNQNDFLHVLRTATKSTLHECVCCHLKPFCNLCIGMSHLEDGDVFGKSSECCRDARIRYHMAKEHTFLKEN